MPTHTHTPKAETKGKAQHLLPIVSPASCRTKHVLRSAKRKEPNMPATLFGFRKNCLDLGLDHPGIIDLPESSENKCSKHEALNDRPL